MLLLVLRAFFRRILKRIQNVLVVRRIDLVGRAAGPVLHIAGQQLIIGRCLICLCLVRVFIRIIVDIRQDVVRGDVGVAGAVHHVHVGINDTQNFPGLFLRGAVFNGKVIVTVAIFVQQHIPVLGHLVGQNFCRDLGHLNVLQQLVLPEQIGKRAARAAGAELAVAGDLAVQRAQRGGDGIIDHIHHLNVVVALAVDIVHTIGTAGRVDMCFTVIGRIHVQNFVEHGARIVLVVIHAGGKGDHIPGGDQRSILALIHLAVKDLLLLVRDDGGDGNAAADAVHVGRRRVDAKVLDHTGDDVGAVDLGGIDLGAVRRKALLGLSVGVFNDRGCRIALQLVICYVVEQKPRHNGTNGNEKFELLEVAQDLKIFHSSPSLFSFS